MAQRACLRRRALPKSRGMKRLIPLLCAAITFSGCATPEEKARAEAAERRQDAAERQRELEEQARENFQREREMEAERRGDFAEARRDAAEDTDERRRDSAERRQEIAEDVRRFREYEVEYARQLGKRPSQLTPAEREWLRANFD